MEDLFLKKMSTETDTQTRIQHLKRALQQAQIDERWVDVREIQCQIDFLTRQLNHGNAP